VTESVPVTATTGTVTTTSVHSYGYGTSPLESVVIGSAAGAAAGAVAETRLPKRVKAPQTPRSGKASNNYKKEAFGKNTGAAEDTESKK